MTEPPGLLIGEFARRCRLPVSTLRYYDRIGLLTPAAVDEGSGYRRYRVDQLPAAELVARLRALEVAPQQIAAVLAGGTGAAEALLGERRRLRRELERTRRRLREVDALLGAGAGAGHRVTRVDLMERQVATHPFRAPFADQEGAVLRAIAELRTQLRRSGIRRAGAWGGTFPLDLGDTVEGMVFTAVENGLDTAGLGSATLPGGCAVTTVHRGGLDSLAGAYLALFSEIDRLGGTPRAPLVEEYVSTTEIQLSVPFTMNG